MKKIVLLAVLAILFAGTAFAQDAKAKDHWISGEVSLLGAGARYEYMLTQNWSIGANVYYNNFFIAWAEFEAGASGRYYIWGKMFFVGVGLGFHQHWGIYDYDWKLPNDDYVYKATWFAAVSGVAITPEVGWKIDVGNPGGFFVQPGIKLPITIGALKPYNDYVPKQVRAGFGVVAYCGLGYAF